MSKTFPQTQGRDIIGFFLWLHLETLKIEIAPRIVCSAFVRVIVTDALLTIYCDEQIL